MSDRPRLPIKNYVGMPAALYLDEFGLKVHDAFGDIPYLVGSATWSKDWRDVDVRLILDDKAFKARYGVREDHRAENKPKWRAECMAWSALATRMTGLPVDFQIQSRTHANNRLIFDGARYALIGALPLHRDEDDHDATA